MSRRPPAARHDHRLRVLRPRRQRRGRAVLRQLRRVPRVRGRGGGAAGRGRGRRSSAVLGPGRVPGRGPAGPPAGRRRGRGGVGPAGRPGRAAGSQPPGGPPGSGRPQLPVVPGGQPGRPLVLPALRPRAPGSARGPRDDLVAPGRGTGPGRGAVPSPAGRRLPAPAVEPDPPPARPPRPAPAPAHPGGLPAVARLAAAAGRPHTGRRPRPRGRVQRPVGGGGPLPRRPRPDVSADPGSTS